MRRLHHGNSILVMTSSFPDDAFRRAISAMQADQPDIAERLFKEALRLQPKHVGALNVFSVLLTRLGRYAEAEHYIRVALNENAMSDATFYNYGLILKALQRPAEALDQFSQALTINPSIAETWNNRGTVLNDLKRYREALADFDRAIAVNANYADAFFNKGNALAGLKLYDQALAAYDRALWLRPDLAETWLARGNVLVELKENAKAFEAYDKALSLKPNLAGAWLSRGNLFAEIDRFDAAAANYDKALALGSGLAEAWLGRGNVFIARKQLDIASASYDRALNLKPDLEKAWLGRGNVFAERKQHDDALAAYDKALAIDPTLAEAWLGRGNVLSDLKQDAAAFAAYDKAIMLKPDLVGAWLGRGNRFAADRRYDDALAAYDKALALKSDFAEVWLGRGIVFFALWRYGDALAAFERSIALKADLAPAWHGCGTVLLRLDRQSEALAALDRALTLAPDFAEAWYVRGYALFEMNRLTEAFAAFDQALEIKPDLSEAISDRIYVLDFASDSGFDEQQKARAVWWQKIGAAIFNQSSVHHANARDPVRRIRVGYVSADFRNHSAAFAVKPVLLNHDKNQFEVTCYSSTQIADELTGQFQGAADRWRDATRMSDAALSEQIQNDQIDILVDLSGHSGGNRLGVFARKPAPIQVTAWGHATGTGLPTIDYLFSDPVTCPSTVRHLFAEKIFDLPCLASIEPLPEQVRPSDPPMQSNGYVTFGVFNRANKISEEATSLWARILHSIPRSRILMKHYAFDQAAMRTQLSERFFMHGISADRIAFLGGTSRQDHLAAFKEIDICLDPFPVNGGISTWESLQMGVPVIAKLGNTMISRSAAAIVTAVGLGDWVSDTPDGYLDIAKKYAAMPEHLKALRAELPAMIMESEAGNSVKYTRAVEAAYRKMWIDYCNDTTR
jgi:predicted O-linked N-acetylglucosamine transferase (SPINDLY family)